MPHLMGIAVDGVVQYGLVITNRRLLFVRVRTLPSSLGLGGGAVGALMMGAFATRSEADLVHDPIAKLAAMKGSVSVPYERIRRLRVKKEFGSSRRAMRLEYTVTKGKRRKFEVYLVPSHETYAEAKHRGTKAGHVSSEFAARAQATLRAYMPADVARQGEWEA